MEFKKFGSISRLSRDMIITEKIDGTNAQICITEDGEFLTGSRKRWITPEDDNYGFSKWAHENKDELMTLGIGHHYGEWWGQGIQCKYGMDRKVFSLFNVNIWNDDEIRPKCCDVVPVLYEGSFDTKMIESVMEALKATGSQAAPGFMNPEGVVIFHKHSNGLFKKTFEHDDKGKSYGS